jgi:4-amino-4-deoxy-L-arabinose transferase-like glycosyltransferase
MMRAIKNCGVLFLILLAASSAFLFSYRIDSFPPYFFCDEAVSGLDAECLIKTGHDSAGVAWPVVFRGLGEYALSATVYFQIPFNYVLGMNEESVRLRTVSTSLFGLGAVACFMWIWGYSRYAWIPFFVFSISPFWYLHSRTGFEYVAAAVFYIVFLCSYIHAVGDGKTKWLLAAAFFAGVCFYCYTPARGWIVCAVLLLGLVNWRYHWSNRRMCAAAIGLGLVVLCPFIVFSISDPDAAQRRLNAVGFGEFKALNTYNKFVHVAEGYMAVLDPRYWFTLKGTLQGVGPRHYIPGLNSIPLWLVLFFALGAAVIIFCNISRIRQRSFVCFLLAVPLPASVVTVNHERVMPVGAIYLLVCVIGLVWAFERLARYLPKRGWIVPGVAVVFSLIYQFFFHAYVHKDSAARYGNYGFYGTQSGSRALYGWILNNEKIFNKIYIAQGTFNGPEVMAGFYLPKGVYSKVINGFQKNIWDGSREITEKELWIASRDEIDEWRELRSPIQIRSLAILEDPAGNPLYEIVELSVQDGYSSWRYNKIAAKQLRKSTLEISVISVGKDRFTVSHPPFASGSIETLFRNQAGVVARVDEINPAMFIFKFSPRVLKEMIVTLTHTSKAIISINAVNDGVSELVDVKEFVSARGDSPVIKFFLPDTPTSELRMTIYLSDSGPDASPHLAGIKIR